MNIKEITCSGKAWQAGQLDQPMPESPVGRELSNEELAEAVDGQQGVVAYDSYANTCHCFMAAYCV